MELTIKGAAFARGRKKEPSLLNWSRLEPLPVTPDLEPGLQAPIADPLWMLGRQWQFNEFQGEDAGTPIDVRVEVDHARIDRVRLGRPRQAPADGARDFQPLARPLEPVVEAEARPRINARMAAESGLQCLRRLRGAGMPAAARMIQEAYLLSASIDAATIDSNGASWLDLLSGRAMDSIALAADLEAVAQPDGSLSGLPPRLAALVADPASARILQLLSVWLAEYRGAIDVGGAGATAWLPERQEYAFAARAKMANGTRVMLDASEYTGGRLDWHSLTVADDPGLGDPAEAVAATMLRPSPKLPTPIRYPGMPGDRYWEFEDGAVGFGRASGGPTELMRLLLIEFALVYGNDWFYVPFEVPVGSLCSIATMRVRDTFGVETMVPAAHRASGQPWRLFELSASGRAASRSWFFLPPVLASRLQGDAIEEVVFFRDEMANMAWAVERRIASSVDGSIDRAQELFDTMLHKEVSGDGISSEIVYRLQTDVPDRWIPLVPVAQPQTGVVGLSHVLERRALIRTRPDGSRATIHPRGLLLRTDPSQAVDSEPALRLAEEEVPREGAIARRVFEYGRWIDGTSFVWLGRDKSVGRGEGASDLRYDILVKAVRGAR